MDQEERKQKIDSILEQVKRHGRLSGNGIPIELWIDAQGGKPGDPAFEEWLKCCTEAVDAWTLKSPILSLLTVCVTCSKTLTASTKVTTLSNGFFP